MISSFKFIFFTLFILLFEGLIFGGNEILTLANTNIFIPPQSSGIWILDILYYFGAMVFWLLSLMANLFQIFLNALFFAPLLIVRVFNGILAIFLLVSFLYLIRGVSE